MFDRPYARSAARRRARERMSPRWRRRGLGATVVVIGHVWFVWALCHLSAAASATRRVLAPKVHPAEVRRTYDMLRVSSMFNVNVQHSSFIVRMDVVLGNLRC